MTRLICLAGLPPTIAPVWTSFVTTEPEPTTTPSPSVRPVRMIAREPKKQLLPMSLPYIGIMGAEAKIARIKNSLSPGEQAEFERQHIYAPIGIRIDSGTADEIAVSIAAELITVRNRLSRR